MRPRTKSVVNEVEYFGQDDDSESDDQDEDEDEDDATMQYAWLAGVSRSKAAKRSSAYSSRDSSMCAIHKKGCAAAATTRERTLTLESWEGTDMDDDDDDEAFDGSSSDDDDGDDLECSRHQCHRHHRKSLERARTCSHDRRISFDSDVNVVTIPARSSFDDEYKRRVWYSREEYSLMRELH